MNISNILMGVQVVLAIVLILSIMPQETKATSNQKEKKLS